VERRVLGGAGCSAQQSKARRAELGFCGGCGGEDGSREAAGGLYKAAANLGVRARVWKAGVDSAGDSGRAVARALRGGDGSSKRGPRVSGGARASGLRRHTRRAGGVR